MLIFPAIDIYEGRAVRLTRGDYAQMTVYSDDPPAVAESFKAAGARYLHTVDLEGARDGRTPNFDTVRAIAACGLKVQVGGGVRTAETAERYLAAGAARVILGTAAVTTPGLVRDMAAAFGGRVAVGVDIRDGFVAIRGWTETTARGAFDFCRELEDAGVQTVICTDISRDGLLSGTNLTLYRELSERLELDVIASGGVSTLGDVAELRAMGLYGAILGRALYTGDIDLAEAIRTAAGGAE
ncbi:MAG: 1-(5-phosphoribosyl)-5-[(5-phosphoribosylamino)methylideneamino]imidazole-4-carboxamide isomerase [Oscillospiraceae bacterium]|nr:1-(5-phosphoribosyl)-5-[(5-phosphoribosylamino)methylideneamino]imidazole-4-carboxamide isomerase [Oscillospiraceae bacterium]